MVMSVIILWEVYMLLGLLFRTRQGCRSARSNFQKPDRKLKWHRTVADDEGWNPFWIISFKLIIRSSSRITNPLCGAPRFSSGRTCPNGRCRAYIRKKALTDSRIDFGAVLTRNKQADWLIFCRYTRNSPKHPSTNFPLSNKTVWRSMDLCTTNETLTLIFPFPRKLSGEALSAINFN